MSRREARWRRWRTGHAAAFTVLAAVCVLAAPWLNTASTGAQLAVLGVLTLAIGLPHGGLDLPVARRWLAPRLGWRWLAVFLTSYVAVAGLVALGWSFAPGGTLGFFLLTAVAHFGISDTDAAGLVGWRRLLEGLGRGVAPVAIPAAAWPVEVTGLFGYLAPLPVAEFLAQVSAALAWPAGGLILFAVILRVIDFRRLGHRHDAAVALELLVLSLVFLRLEPLAAFTVYWIGLHSLKVLLHAATAEGKPTGTALFRTALNGMPATAGALVLAVPVYATMFSGTAPTAAGVGILFMGLAALNAPHRWAAPLKREES